MTIHLRFWKAALITPAVSRTLLALLLFPVACVLLLVSSGCGSTASSTSSPSKTVTSLAVSAPSGTVAVAATEQLTATASYSDGSSGNVTTTVTWASAQAAVATVSTGGVVTGVAAGTTQVSASLGAVSGSMALKVPTAPVTLTSIAVTPAGAAIAVGATQQLTATASYSDGSTSNVTASATWSSSNAGVVTVSSSGLTTGIASGTATITATVNGVSGATTVTTAAAVGKTLTQLTVAPSSAALMAGKTQQFTATATYSDGSSAIVTAAWSSSAPSLVTVNATGLADAVAAGTAKITASYSGLSGTATVTVAAAQTLVSLAVSPATVSVAVGATQQLSGSATYSDGSTATVTAQVSWTSSNASVATVSASGLVTGVAAGSATITGTLDGKSATSAVTATANPISAIAVTPNPVNVALGATQQLTATATYTDHSTGDVTGKVTWSVANANVATVDATGLLTPVSSGTTQITATLNSTVGTDGLLVQIAAGTGVNIPTWQQGVTRQGLNDGEQSLTPANVNAQSFGKLFSYTLDGYAYAEPLLMSNIQIQGAAHNVLYVATENDSVYAFDADSYGTGQPLWHTSLLQSGETPMLHASIQPALGVTSTPVIDPSTNTIYVVSAQTASSGSSTFRLTALDITTGQQEAGSPVTIQASVPGSNSDAVNGVVSLTNSCVQRAALLLANGNIYMGFGSCHSGWLLAYNARSLAQVGVFNASPNLNGEGPYASAGGIWMGGGGPTADSNGNVYVATGNGPWDGQTAYGDTVLKFDPTLHSVTDLFTPDDYAYLNCKDTDLAAGGVSLLPGGTQILSGGKSGQLFLVNLNPSLGGEQPNDAGVAQEIDFNQGLANPYMATCSDTSGTHQGNVNSYEIFGTGASFNGSVFLGVTPTAANIPAGVRQFSYTGGVLTPGVETAPSIQMGSYGTTPFISADGTSNGILWMVDHGTPLQSGTPTAATLRAYDAESLGTELYDSSQNSTDAPGFGIKFTSPIVGNGKVYISTGMDPVGSGARGAINVYGLK